MEMGAASNEARAKAAGIKLMSERRLKDDGKECQEYAKDDQQLYSMREESCKKPGLIL